MTERPPDRVSAGRATLFVALSACGFGAIAIFVTVATGTGAPLLGILSWRYILGALLLGAVARLAGVRRIAPIASRIVLMAGFAQALIAVVSLSALRYIPAGTLSFLFYTYPAWVAVIARLRHSEPMTRVRLFALALSLVGIFVMIGSPDGSTLHPVGVALALVSALIYAAYVPMIGALQQSIHEVEASAYVCAGAALFLGLAATTRGELTTDMHVTAWKAILALAVISTAGAFLMFLRGLRVLGPVRTAIVSTVEPFFTALLGAWVLSQPITRRTLIGGAFIATAVVLLQLGQNGRRTGPPG